MRWASDLIVIYQLQDGSENCDISGGSYPSGGKHMVCSVFYISYAVLYTYPPVLTTIQGRSNKSNEIFLSLTGAIRAIRNAWGGVLDSVLALVIIMMMMVVPVTLIIMRKKMIVLIMMLDKRQITLCPD